MERAENIQNAERNILFIYNNPSSYTDDDIKFLSDQLSNGVSIITQPYL